MDEMLSEVPCGNDQPPFYSSGSADIDALRHEVKASPTSGDNYRQRALLLYMWLSALQQQGANTRPFTNVDKRYYLLEGRIVAAVESEAAGEHSLLLSEMADPRRRGLLRHGDHSVPPRRAGAYRHTERERRVGFPGRRRHGGRVAHVPGRHPPYGLQQSAGTSLWPRRVEVPRRPRLVCATGR